MENSKKKIKKTFDYIIVGAGAAGCVITRRLLDNTNATILLLEAGGSHMGQPTLESPSRWPENLFTNNDYGYQFEPGPFINNRVLSLNRGKVLGGSGSINFMVWARGNRYDYDGWAAAGNEGWDYNSVLPLFKNIEDWEDGETDFHGAGGPISIQRAKDIDPGSQALLDGAQEFGLPMLKDTNGPSPEGVGYEVLNVKDGKRSSPATGYLEPVLKHPNLTLVTHATVIKLNFIGNTCVGLDYLLANEVHTAAATSEVVLCAGAVDTPRLLMLSGIGDERELSEVGIETHLDLWGVGKNMQDHVILHGLCFRAKEPLIPYNNNLLGSTVYWKSQKALAASDIMILSPQIPFLTPEIAALYPPEENCFTLAPSLLNIESRGYIKMKTNKFDGPLEIQPNHLGTETDLKAMVEGLELALDISNQRAFQKKVERTITPTRFKNHADIVDFVRNAAGSYQHVSCTCAMGDGPEAVVNDKLLVHNTFGLRIADASIMPKVISGNTHAPSLMIGEFAAALIIADTLQ